jgi:hypothetical protein
LSRNLPIETGDYAIDGQVTSLLASRKLICEIGSYSLTGYDVDLERWIIYDPNEIILLDDGKLAKRVSGSFFLKL